MGLPMDNNEDTRVSNSAKKDTQEVFNWEATVSSWADECSKVDNTDTSNDRRKPNQRQPQHRNTNTNHPRQQNQKNRGPKHRNQHRNGRNNPDEKKQVYRQRHEETQVMQDKPEQQPIQKSTEEVSSLSSSLVKEDHEPTLLMLKGEKVFMEQKEKGTVAESEESSKSEESTQSEHSSVVSTETSTTTTTTTEAPATEKDPLEGQIISQYKQHVYVPEAVQAWCQSRNDACRAMISSVLESSGATSMALNFTQPTKITKNLPIRMWYDLSAPEQDQVALACLLVQTHLTNQTNLMRLTKQKTQLEAALRATKDELERKHSEEFCIPPEMLAAATGVDGANINVIKDKTGVEHIAIDVETARVCISGSNALAVKQARRMLEYTQMQVSVTPQEMQYLKSAFKLQEIRQLAKVFSVKEGSDTRVDIMGLKTAVTAASLLLKTDLQYNQQFAHLQQEKNDIQLELEQLDPTGLERLEDVEESTANDEPKKATAVVEVGDIAVDIPFSKSSSFHGEEPDKANHGHNNHRRRNNNSQNNGNNNNRRRNNNSQNNGNNNNRRRNNGNNNNRRMNSEDFYTKKGPSAQEHGGN